MEETGQKRLPEAAGLAWMALLYGTYITRIGNLRRSDDNATSASDSRPLNPHYSEWAVGLRRGCATPTPKQRASAKYSNKLAPSVWIHIGQSKLGLVQQQYKTSNVERLQP